MSGERPWCLMPLRWARRIGSRLDWRFRIRVNAIAPGAIATDFGGGAVRDNNDVNAYVAQGIALGRVEPPVDIGGAVATILSDDMGWANGTSFDISGRQLL